ncbi:MAG: hypothetical protein ACFE8A_15165 [Candidatus Hodarchaeota archaeon]
MNRKSRKLIVISMIFIIIASAINIKKISNENTSSDEIEVEKSFNKEKIKDEPLSIEQPKTAGPSGQSYNFTFNTTIYETWNRTWVYPWSFSNRGGDDSFSWLIQYDTVGYSVFYEFNITDLINMSDIGFPKLYPSTINLALEQYNDTGIWEHVAYINDGAAIGDGYCSGFINMEPYLPGAFRVTYDYFGKTNITYYPIMKFWRNPFQSEIRTEFIPDTQNTQSDLIKWELTYENFLPGYILGYRANLTIENFTFFTLREIKGRKGLYWEPINYTMNNDFLIITESAEEYIIELQTPNYVSIIYNDNLTWKTNSNELNLHTTCKMAGNLTIQFRDTNGTIHEDIKDQPVVKDQEVYFNYIMPRNATGGIGYLNVTLINNSKILFGVKIAEINFYKQAIIVAFTNDTYAFEPRFFVAAFYVDFDYFIDLIINYGYDPDLDFIEVLNLTMIPNATITYDLEGYIGELDYTKIPIPEVDFMVYLKEIDLRELQLPSEMYNLTFRASKPFYDSGVNVTKINIWKRPVEITISSTNNIYAIEENFTIIIDLSVEYPGFGVENYLRVLSTVNITFINNDTGKIDIGPIPWWEPIIQTLDISDSIKNTTIPGTYMLNVTLDSDYYEGTGSFFVKIIRKELEISVGYSSLIKESISTNFTWILDEGTFVGNRENMTLEILVDNISTKNVSLSLTSNSSGYNLFSFTPGIHNITYRLISPFYYAEETIEFVVQALPPPGDDDDDDDGDKEENIILLMIIILILIGVSILAIFMVISRHKVKAQRELEFELIALKTKTAATEQKISLIETQISEIASIYWVLVVHSEQGVTLVEIADFKFEDVIGEEQKELIGKGMLRDSALIGGFLTAIRNFSRETSGTSLEYQPVFNSQTDYSTIVNDNEVHRRILEGTHYFMAFVSSRGTMEISDVLSFINSKFELAYGEAVKNFEGAISPFRSFEEIVVEYLHEEIKALQKKLIEERLELEQHERHLREVQEKIGIKPKKLK